MKSLKSVLIILLINVLSSIVYSNSNHPNIYIDESIEHSEQINLQIQSFNSTLQLFSHGTPGHLFIEDEWKNAEEIVDWINIHYKSKKYNHINFYACNFAKGAKGKAAVSYIEKELAVSIAASDDVTGIDGDWELEVGNPIDVIELPQYKANLQSCSNGNFAWDNGFGGGQVFPFDSQSESYTLNAGGSLGVDLDIIDPFNLNADNDYYVAGSHPWDPAGGCNNLGNFNGQVGPLTNPSINCGVEADNVPGDGSIWDPWDSDCSLDPTQTNGVYGLNYLTIWMRSENSDQEVEYRFTFDRPVDITDFRISDIDAVGFYANANICDLERLGNSYQDEVRLAATDACGDPVALDILPSSAQPGSQIVIDPMTQSVYSEYDPNLNSNISPDNLNGEILVTSTKPVTSFSIFYSNGPDDQSWEENNAAAYPWWSNTNGALSGASDDHAIRIDGFTFCACPDANIAVTGSGCEGSPVTYSVSADYTIAELIVDGVSQPSTNSFTVASATTTSYEVVVVGEDDCKETFTFNAVANPIPSTPVIAVTDNDCSTLSDGQFTIVTDCGAGSTLEWSTDNGNSWSTNIPSYDPISPVTVLARCVNNTTQCLSPTDTAISAPTICCEEVSGVAFLDANNDGCQSGAEEIGVEGMEASIFECDANGVATGGALASVSTGVDGSYAFGPDEVGAGMVCLDPFKTYTVTFSFPADGSLDNLNYSTGDPAGAGACTGTDSSDDSAANDGTTGCYDPFADTDDEHIDIGLYPCEEVSGVAFLDANNDGCQSGAEEVGVEGMEASLFACDANGVATGTALATVSTGADGSYAFGPDEVGAGMICLDPAVMYTISFAFPADGSLDNLNYSTGDPAGAGACAGTESSDDSAANDGTTGCVDPSADTDDEHIDIGLYPCEEVSGVAFLDANNDGCQSGAEEVGVEGMEASLFACDANGVATGTALATVSTGADGSYAFGPDELGAGMICLDPAVMYTVSFAFPADGSLDNLNYSTGDPAGAGACAGTDSSDDSAANDGTTGCVDPSADTDDEHIDIGLYPCEEVSGVAFLDANNDGCQSGADEVGVEGMEASIFACDANGVATGTALATMSTGADGSYAFGPDEVGAGMICLDPAVMYTVSFAFPADGSLDNLNYSTGDPAGAGACAGTDSSDDSAANDGTTGCVDPSADTDDEHIDIGLYPCETVAGVVFVDADEDGCQAMASDGFEGVAVELYSCNSDGTFSLVATTATGPDGSYAFGPDIGPGNVCLDPAVEYRTQISAPSGFSFTEGIAAACPGDEDDSPANDGISDCYNPSDTDPVDMDTDEHIDFGIYCGVKTDAIFTGSGNACYIVDGNPVYRNIVTDDSEILPPGYEIVYILVDDTGTIVLFNTLSEYFISDYGMFLAYSVAYDPNDYDVTTATTIEDITSNWTCGDISAPAEIRVVECCLASSGWLTDAVTNGCADPANGTTANLTATQKGLRVPTGYQVVYLLRDGLTDILLDYSFTLSFDVDQVGSYYISPLVYDPANLDITAIDYGNEDIFSFNIYLFNLGVCDHFNISGIQLLVGDCCQEDLYIPGAGIGVNGGLYEVSQNITSDGTVNSANVEFSAGNSVELMAGFEVELGMEFHAFIEGCN